MLSRLGFELDSDHFFPFHLYVAVGSVLLDLRAFFCFFSSRREDELTESLANLFFSPSRYFANCFLEHLPAELDLVM